MSQVTFIQSKSGKRMRAIPACIGSGREQGGCLCAPAWAEEAASFRVRTLAARPVGHCPYAESVIDLATQAFIAHAAHFTDYPDTRQRSKHRDLIDAAMLIPE